MALIPLLVMSAATTLLAQVPCQYDVTVIQAPECPIFGLPPTYATGISPNGRYVVGRYRGCDLEDQSFVYDTDSTEFFTIPRPSGVTRSAANDVNDNGWVVGTYWRTTTTQRGYVYDFLSRKYIAELEPLPNGSWSGASAINNKNQVCGFRSIGSKGDPVNPFNAFIWSEKDGFTDLGVMNGPNSAATDINENGDVCGWTGRGNANNGDRAFTYLTGAILISPAIPNGTSSIARGVNKSRDVAGRGRIPAIHSPGFTSHGFIYTRGSIRDIGTLPSYLASFAFGITDSRIIVGFSRVLADGSDALQAYVWNRTSMRAIDEFLPTDADIQSVYIAWAINNSNSIVGEAIDDKGYVVGVLLTPSVIVPGDVDHNCITNVDDLGLIFIEWGKNLSAADINLDGIVDWSDLLIVIMNWS